MRIKLFNKSAFVSICTFGIVESTKYLLPIAPKIAPTLSPILDSNSFNGIKKTIQEIKKDKNDPIKKLNK